MSDLFKKISLTSMEDIVALSLPFLEMGKKVKFTVVGNSMHPLFCNQRDNVTVKKALKVKKRDIILYRRGDGSYVLHRVVGKGKLGFKLCGDNQIAVEYPVKQEDVVAVVTSFERKGKVYTVKNLLYKIYSFWWCSFIGLRPLGSKIVTKIHKLLNKRSR